MNRRAGFVALAASIGVACVCAGLIGWRVMKQRESTGSPVTVATTPETAPSPKPTATPQPRMSAIIDLPGDPVLIRRGAVGTPKDVLIAVPPSLTQDAVRLGSPGYSIKQAYFIASTLASSDGGYMGRFSESGGEADALAAQAERSAAVPEGVDTQAQIAAGTDDDGGADTPLDAQLLTSDNSNKLEINPGGSQGKRQILDTVLKPVVQENLGDLLIANGFREESARAIESAAAKQLRIQTLPPGSVVMAIGALDAAGDYRAAQVTVFEGGEYVGAVAIGDGGDYGDAAEPAASAGLESTRQGDIAVRYDVADGVYSAGLRSGVPEDVVREAIQLVAGQADLRAALQPGQSVRLLYMRDFRDKARAAGRVIYVGLHGGALAVDCYAFEQNDGRFRCFDPKSETDVPTPQPRPRDSGPVESLGSSGATSVRGILAPIKGAPVTSLFGMRFHPILHILRLHAGIDFGAPVGSPVRASADGTVEIAAAVSGFGNHIRIQHAGFETSYSHLSEIPASIKPGVLVRQGDIIALSGNTGLSTGPHLHFEFYLNRDAADPLPHLGTEVQSSTPTEIGLPSPVGAPGASPSGASSIQIALFSAIRSYIDTEISQLTK